MNFRPFGGYVEVEPISSEGIIQSEEKKFVELAKVVSVTNSYGIDIGDIISFRPHGFFEIPEYEGKKHYVVRVDPEFILGIFKNNVAT